MFRIKVPILQKREIKISLHYFQIEKAESEDEKKRLQEEFNDKEKKARRRSAGNTRFIGELYKLEMLTVSLTLLMMAAIQLCDEQMLNLSIP